MKPRRYSVKKDGKIVGYAAVVPQDDGSSHLTIISVDSAYRGMKLGSKMINAIIDREFNKFHSIAIKLEARPDDKNGFVKSWYERLGFKSTGNGSWMELNNSSL
jgi:ribosomal protein S18 acetylase RimI-like enzyme